MAMVCIEDMTYQWFQLLQTPDTDMDFQGAYFIWQAISSVKPVF